MKYSLKELRARKQVRQADVAKALGISKTTYNRIENQLLEARIGYLIDVANYFEVTPDDILLENLK